MGRRGKPEVGRRRTNIRARLFFKLSSPPPSKTSLVIIFTTEIFLKRDRINDWTRRAHRRGLTTIIYDRSYSRTVVIASYVSSGFGIVVVRRAENTPVSKPGANWRSFNNNSVELLLPPTHTHNQAVFAAAIAVAVGRRSRDIFGFDSSDETNFDGLTRNTWRTGKRYG